MHARLSTEGSKDIGSGSEPDPTYRDFSRPSSIDEGTITSADFP